MILGKMSPPPKNFPSKIYLKKKNLPKNCPPPSCPKIDVQKLFCGFCLSLVLFLLKRLTESYSCFSQYILIFHNNLFIKYF